MASGENAVTKFKRLAAADSTFVGGFTDPDKILIVGHDIPIEDWNEDLADAARLAIALNTITPEFVASIVEFGVTDEIKVIFRRDLILAVDGRRRILGAREAKKIRAKAGSQTALNVPITEDKTKDVATTARLGNLFRHEDPVWIQPAQMAHQRRMGKDDEKIRILFGIDASTMKSWDNFLNLDPKIVAMVAAKDLTFASACMIGSIGEREFKKQNLALDYLKATGAKITGEAGRENVRNVVKGVKNGSITDVPESAPAVVEEPERVVVIPSAETERAQAMLPPADPKLAATIKNGETPMRSHTPEASRPTKAPKPEKEKKGKKEATRIHIQGTKLSPAAIRYAYALIEGEVNTDDPVEAAVFAVLGLIVGDNGLDDLKPWDFIHKAFKATVRSDLNSALAAKEATKEAGKSK